MLIMLGVANDLVYFAAGYWMCYLSLSKDKYAAHFDDFK